MEITRIINNYNISQLICEIKKELLLDLYDIDGHVNISGDTWTFIFNQDLTELQQSTLDAVINAHVPVLDWESGLKFKINNSTEDPSNINYDILGLHKKRTIILGELRKVEYFKNFDGVIYSDLIVEETREYFRDENGLVLYRIQVSKWMLNNGEVGLEKTFTKHYSPTESIDEGVERRKNVIAIAKVYILSQVGQMYAFDFLTDVKYQISLFEDGYTQPLKDAIAASSKPYLTQETKDTTINLLQLSLT